MTRTVKVGTESSLDELVTWVKEGTEIVLTEDDQPVARIVALESPPPRRRVAGLHLGAMRMSDDFDAPLPEEFWTGDS